MKNNPLILGDGVNCVITNPFKWLVVKPDDKVLKQQKIDVFGATIIFPSLEVKTMFLMQYL